MAIQRRPPTVPRLSAVAPVSVASELRRLADQTSQMDRELLSSRALIQQLRGDKPAADQQAMMITAVHKHPLRFLHQVKLQICRQAIAHNHGNIAAAARDLGIPRKRLLRILESKKRS